MSVDSDIGLLMLRDVRDNIKKLKKYLPDRFAVGMWSYSHACGMYEVCLPNVDFRWNGHAGSAYEAKAIALGEFIDTHIGTDKVNELLGFDK